MRDLAFYNAGGDSMSGPKAPLVLARRLLRRILRPIFQSLEQMLVQIHYRIDDLEREHGTLRSATEPALDELTRRQDELSDRTRQSLAFGWDYVAAVRRIAALEDRVEELTTRLEAANRRAG